MKPVLLLAALLVGVRGASAQSLSVSGSPSLLRVNAAIAGSAPTAVSNSSTTYTVNIGNHTSQNITARINTAMPAGVTLKITLAAPSSAVSLGAVTLSTTSQNVVTSLDKNVITTQSITYQLSATAAAGVVSSQSRTVTLTVVTGT